MFDILLNTPLSYIDSIWYYNIGETRVFLAQKSKLTQLASKLINSRLRLQSLIFFLLAALEHLEREIFRLLQIIPIVIDKFLKKS